MRHIKINITFTIILLLICTIVKAQHMKVVDLNTNQSIYSLNNVRKMDFSLGNVSVIKNDNSISAFALNNLRHITFSNATTNLTEQLNSMNQGLIAYPNPVSSFLQIDLGKTPTSEGIITIIGVDGKIVKTYTCAAENMCHLNISDIANGIYILRYSNSTELRTIKIIKE